MLTILSSKETDLNRSLLEYHSTGGHDLLVTAGNIPIPTARMTSLIEIDMDSVQSLGHHGEGVDGLKILAIRHIKMG